MELSPVPQPMSSALPAGGGRSPSTRFVRLVGSGCPSHGVTPSRYIVLNSSCRDPMSQRSQISREPVHRLHVDGPALAVFTTCDLEVWLDLVGRHVALDHLDQLFVGGGLDAADDTV